MLLSKGRGVTQIPIPYSRWWFIESYLLVMLFAPAIDLMFKYVEKKQILIIVGALFYYSYVGRFLKFQNSHDFIMLLTVYVLARYMAINRELKILFWFIIDASLSYFFGLGDTSFNERAWFSIQMVLLVVSEQ